MKKQILIALGCLAAISVNAQANFTGTWKFVNQESVSGKLYSNGSPKAFVVKQNAETITIERTSAGANGNDVTSSETVLFGGKATESTSTSGRPKKASITWAADKNSFIEITEIFNAADKTKLEMKITDTWSMDGGKLLLLRRNENLTNGEVWESKAWYEKN